MSPPPGTNLLWLIFSADFDELFPQRNAGADVMNGISLSGHPDILYLTGKRWSKMFKVRLLA